MASIEDRLGAIKAAKGYVSGTPNYPELLASLFEDTQIDDGASVAVPLTQRLGKGFAFANSQSSLGTFFEMSSGLPASEGICCRMIVGHEQVGDDAYFAAIRQVKSPSDDEVRTFCNAASSAKAVRQSIYRRPKRAWPR
jgi:hypothetical protein